MRVAFFGGSFDPPHCGHIAIAKAAADLLRLEQVLFAPVGRQPLKHGLAMASYADRLAMVRLAVSADARFVVSELDAPRPDAGHNYTYDTLLRLTRELPVETELFCLMGADSFRTLASWHRARELMTLCDFIVAARPGYALAQVEACLPTGIVAAGGSDTLRLSGDGGERTLYLLRDVNEDISATTLREAIAREDAATCERMLPQGVAAYIHAHDLYEE